MVNIAELIAVPETERGPEWLKRSVRAAIKLEFATIPPYLIAMWSIRDPDDPVAQTIREIVLEEMLHMGLACNMLSGLGESPALDTADFIPSYPGPLPGGVNPNLAITLRRLTPSQLKVFMDIEYPEGGPITPAFRSFDTIGAFYAALIARFEAVCPALDISKQRAEKTSGIFVLKDVADVKKAIDLIRRQGEGSKKSPEEKEMSGLLAHYYQFREVYIGSQYVLDPTTMKWGHTGPPVLMPLVFPMADIPVRGYQRNDVLDSTTWALIDKFDGTYTAILRGLRRAWEDQNAPLGDFSANDPIQMMLALRHTARELMQRTVRPGEIATFGPCFRFV